MFECTPWQTCATAITAVGETGKQNYICTQVRGVELGGSSIRTQLAAIAIALEYAREKYEALKTHQQVDVTITTNATVNNTVMPFSWVPYEDDPVPEKRRRSLPITQVIIGYAEDYQEDYQDNLSPGYRRMEQHDLFERSRIAYQFLMARGNVRFVQVKVCNPQVRATRLAAYHALLGAFPAGFFSGYHGDPYKLELWKL